MNKKLLSIAYFALTLCTISTVSGVDDVTILDVPAKTLMSEEGVTTIVSDNPNDITMINISEAGVKIQVGRFSGTPNSIDRIKIMFTENPPSLIECSSKARIESYWLTGSLVVKEGTKLSVGNFDFQTLSVFGTNSKLTLNFIDPRSLIKSITLESSVIVTTHEGEELHIGSIWGKFTGAPSSDAQIIHFIGYPSITIEFNPTAIEALRSKK